MKSTKYVILIILTCIIVFSLSAYIILRDFNELTKNNKAIENLIKNTTEVNKDTKEKNFDWNSIKSINDDIVGWIEIDGTNISYPILKDKNLYYLKHSFEREYNSNGSIFTTNLMPFEDSETEIYGHNMRNGSMFSNLDNYLNKDFLYSYPSFKIYTPEFNYEAFIFSVYFIDIENEINNIKHLNFNEKINYYKKMTKFQFENDCTINKIVKLSTCSYLNTKVRPTNQRLYIIANLIRK